MRIKRLVGAPVRRALDLFGYELRRRNGPGEQGPGEGFIDAAETLAAAKARGQSLHDYLAELWDTGDNLERITAFLYEHAKLPDHSVMLEIGAGVGAFLDAIRRRYVPSRYEVYEINPGWADYLGSNYPVEIMNANGADLSQTPDNSCDLVHAHYVFTYLEVVTAFGYFGEMCRVLRPGGFAFFDLFLDDHARWKGSRRGGN